jgi:hypothetical protein
MIVPIKPKLHGAAARRFLALAKSLARAQQRHYAPDLQQLLDEEISWVQNSTALDGQEIAYEASARVLLDLVRLGWEVNEHGYGIELISNEVRNGQMTPEEIQIEKRKIRALFRPTVHAQLSDPAVISFVQRLESPPERTGKNPVTLLIAEGEELHARLVRAKQEANPEDNDPLKTGCNPYLQMVESDGVDEFTGHSLRDIWRYFRYTWSIPQFSTPGRQLLYLVRDAAHPCHAVMGIIGLNNAAFQLGKEREYFLGWSLCALKERLAKTAEDSPQLLKDEISWAKTQLSMAIADIENAGLVSEEEKKNPTASVIARLRRRAQEFDSLRDETLRELSRSRTGIDAPLTVQESELVEELQPPVADDMLLLEAKPSINPIMQKARRHLIARKRAALLADLLRARMVIAEQELALLDSDQISLALQRDDVSLALQTVLNAVKSRHAGTNMLEITTCGAVNPYRHMLGGKLAALLLFSPEIADDYQKNYTGPTIILSQMKNAPIVPDNTLVYLGTTSLYSQGSSQYKRVVLPPGVISEEQSKLRYVRVGKTSGFGTLQFMNSTRESVEAFLMQTFNYRDVNSIFGEGPSPKLRKLSAGLRELGFPPDSLLRHNHQRLIYAVELTENARPYLSSRPCDLPDYVRNPGDFRDATTRIATFWRNRWLASRMKHAPSMGALLQCPTWKLSDLMERNNSLEMSVSAPPQNQASRNNQVSTTENNVLSFWTDFAAAGPRTTSEGLSADDLNRLNVPTPLADFVEEKVRNGVSVFLTGNAGDGKTHVLRLLAPTLRSLGAVVIEDATATMRRGQIQPVLEQWRHAVASNVPFCIAINEYPLYLLRQAARESLPELVFELNRQCQTRLVYGAEPEDNEVDLPLVLVDLSLRNPLREGYADVMLQKVTTDLLSVVDLEDSDTTIGRNLRRLQDSRVAARLTGLFERLADTGYRATMRELWNLLSRLCLGYRSDQQSTLGSGVAHWFSEVLFVPDDRFKMSYVLRETDPAYMSHPIWDARLEDRAQLAEAGWWFDVPRPAIDVRPDRATFRAIKRAFLFEHESGLASFDLEHADVQEFRELLHSHNDNDTLAVSRIVEAINQAYCGVKFPSRADSLYLWTGHRFHEQPSLNFLANRRVPASSLSLLLPHIPRRVADALPEYKPDHLLLVHGQDDGYSSGLRVDFPLYLTLKCLARGLPRKLLPERDSFRIDRFIEALHRSGVPEERRVLSTHLGRRELLDLELTADRRKYARIYVHN